jgi:hypothetical protein
MMATITRLEITEALERLGQLADAQVKRFDSF